MENTKIISVDAIQNISQLKDNIKALKAEVDTLTVGTEAYNNAVTALAENQRALKLAQTGVYGSMQEVASASKLDTDAINDTVSAAQKGISTYNEMSAALGQLKNEIKAVPKYLSEQDQAIGKLNPTYQELNAKIQQLDSSLKSLDADNGVFSRNVGNYKGALEEWGGTMGQLKQVGNDLQGGIMGLLGVMTLFGVDTENTKESLQALVPIIAVLNSAKGIGGLAKIISSTTTGQKALAAATVASTAANTANATSAGAVTVATEAETVAQDTLNKTMLANPILAIIAGLTALLGVIAKYISNTNKAAKETEAFKKQQEDLNKKFDEQNEAFEREQKLKQAQGVSNQVLLAQKKEHIIAQKKETEAIKNNIEIRIKQMKADSAWVRFWKGEIKAIKNLEEQLKSLNEEIKSFDNQIANLNVDIQVDVINQGKKAASKAVQETSELIKKALNIANEAIKANRTELENLTANYEEQSTTLNNAFEKLSAKLNKMKKGTKEYNDMLKMAQTIFNGMIIIDDKYQEQTDKITKDNSRQEYLKKITGIYNELFYTLNKGTKEYQKYESLLDSVLGFSNYTQAMLKVEETSTGVILKGSKATEILVQSYKELGMVIEQDIKELTGFNGALTDLTVNGLNWDAMLHLSQTDADSLIANVGEPLATAIGQWANNDKSLEEASAKWLTESFAQGMSLFDDAIKRGEAGPAQIIKDSLLRMLENAYPDNNDEIRMALVELWRQLQNQINDVIANDEYSLNFAEKFSAVIAVSGTQASFDAILKIADDFNQAYVASTADAISAVADLWETSIKWKYKKLVESGKMTEQEAEKQAKKEFETVKALQIGVAAISTAAAVVQALADPTVPNYYVKAANAIAAGLAGAAQIITISMTEFGKPSVNTNTSSVSTPSYTQEPQGMYYSVGINPADYAEAAAQNSVKVYVTDQDIVEGIDNYNARRAEVTF